ncbi:MAG: 5'-methylthioadenosine/S-adenosylhomocysteine nucleosidase [Clostridia bacterium]|nr:5'-methylthioadenosine/S-adenosylhomocysteine nucleosidase [Clostridia bacterium]
MKVFVIAMEKEASPVIDVMDKVKKTEKYGREIYTGKLGSYKTAVIVSGVGKANAAAAAQMAISDLSADGIINAGTAGALTNRCQVGSIYGIRDCVQYDFDLTQLNHTKIGTLDEYDENFLPLSTFIKYPLRRLATGDRFNDDKGDFRLLTRELGADIRDMECGAIVHVCRHAGVPVYAVKVITDVAGSGSTPAQFSENFEKCVKYMADNIKDILKEVEKAK